MLLTTQNNFEVKKKNERHAGLQKIETQKLLFIIMDRPKAHRSRQNLTDLSDAYYILSPSI